MVKSSLSLFCFSYSVPRLSSHPWVMERVSYLLGASTDSNGSTTNCMRVPSANKMWKKL
jgi:hypothetical protein